MCLVYVVCGVWGVWCVFLHVCGCTRMHSDGVHVLPFVHSAACVNQGVCASVCAFA